MGDKGTSVLSVHNLVPLRVKQNASYESTSRSPTLCRELLGVEISTESGLKKIKEENLVKRVCPQFVKDAAEILFEFQEFSSERKR